MSELRSKFVAWLQTFEEGAEVGIAGAGCQCPLARYYTEVEKKPSVSVAVDLITWFDTERFFKVTEPWEQFFINSIDAYGPVPITKELALNYAKHQYSEGQ